jgi:hypothetical protein
MSRSGGRTKHGARARKSKMSATACSGWSGRFPGKTRASWRTRRAIDRASIRHLCLPRVIVGHKGQAHGVTAARSRRPSLTGADMRASSSRQNRSESKDVDKFVSTTLSRAHHLRCAACRLATPYPRGYDPVTAAKGRWFHPLAGRSFLARPARAAPVLRSRTLFRSGPHLGLLSLRGRMPAAPAVTPAAAGFDTVRGRQFVREAGGIPL